MPSGLYLPRSSSTGSTVWFSVTVRVAWELMLGGVRVRPSVLCDARDHALACLPTGVGPDEAEVLAGAATRDFIIRAKEARYERTAEIPDMDLTIHRGWRDQLFEAMDPVGDAVLRLHYGDGMPISEVERTAAIDGGVISAAREGIRETTRSIVDTHGAGGWSEARVDELICRIVGVPAPGCPEPTHLLSEAQRDHVDACPRCSRAVRLIRGGLLAPLDLVAPGGEPQTNMMSLAAILLHPDARKHRRRVVRALGDAAIRVGRDGWLLDPDDLARVGPALRALAEESRPPRHHLRGAIVTGPGRWSGKLLLGPVAIRAMDTARSRPWSEVDQLGELPTPRPPAPRATRWWLGAGLAAVAAGLVAIPVFQPEAPPPSTPIAVEFQRKSTGWVIRFDTEDLAVVDVVGVVQGSLTLLHAGARSEKGRWATGDGDFQLVAPGTEVALIASRDGIPELPGLVDQARAQPAPMSALEVWVRTAHPTVDFVVSPAIINELEPAAPGALPSPAAR